MAPERAYMENLPRGSRGFPFDYHLVTRNHCRFYMPRHFHIDHELIRVLKGEFTVSLNERQIRLQPGQYLLVGDGMVHGGTPFSPDVVYECLVFNLNAFSESKRPSNIFIEQLQRHQVILNSFFDQSHREDRGICELMDGIFSLVSATRHDPECELLAYARMLSLLGQIQYEHRYEKYQALLPSAARIGSGAVHTEHPVAPAVPKSADNIRVLPSTNKQLLTGLLSQRAETGESSVSASSAASAAAVKAQVLSARSTRKDGGDNMSQVQASSQEAGTGKGPAYPEHPAKHVLSSRSLHYLNKSSAVFRYIFEHYTEEISLADMAQAADLDPRYFCRFFKELTGMRPSDYINKFRIEHAAHRLTLSDEPVYNIAYACGYKDPSYFTRMFSRYQGCSPRTFRKRIRQANAAPTQSMKALEQIINPGACGVTGAGADISSGTDADVGMRAEADAGTAPGIGVAAAGAGVAAVTEVTGAGAAVGPDAEK